MAKIAIVTMHPVTPTHTAELRALMTAAGVEKPRARCFPDGLGRINIRRLADRDAVIRLLIDRGACKSWGEAITEADLTAWNGNGGLEYFFRWHRKQQGQGNIEFAGAA